METISTVYVCKDGYQPTFAGTDAKGEFIWTFKMKEPWHLKMFPVRYGGDFSEQWMRLRLYEQGYDWDFC